MKIFLLGHKGFIGSHLLPKLQTLDHEVVTDMRYWNDRYNVIINLAAVTHIRNEFDPKMYESNVVLVNEVFKRPERIIYASSCSAAYFTNPYAGTKLWAEYLGNKHGNALGLRFHNVYGPNNNKGLIWWLMNQPNGAKINVRGVSLVRDYIYVDDVVDYIVSHLSGLRFITTIDVGTGIGLETMDVVNLYTKLSGKVFDISASEPGTNEPERMVSNNPIPNALTLEEGLLKMINNGNAI